MTVDARGIGVGLFALSSQLIGCPSDTNAPDSRSPSTTGACAFNHQLVNDLSDTTCDDLSDYLNVAGVTDSDGVVRQSLAGVTLGNWQFTPTRIDSVSGCQIVPAGTDVRIALVTKTDVIFWTPPPDATDACREEARRWNHFVQRHECAHVQQATEYAASQPDVVELPVTISACAQTSLSDLLQDALAVERARRDGELQKIFDDFDLSIDGSPAARDCSKCPKKGEWHGSISLDRTTSSEEASYAAGVTYKVVDTAERSWTAQFPSGTWSYRYVRNIRTDDSSAFCSGYSETHLEAMGSQQAYVSIDDNSIFGEMKDSLTVTVDVAAVVAKGTYRATQCSNLPSGEHSNSYVLNDQYDCSDGAVCVPLDGSVDIVIELPRGSNGVTEGSLPIGGGALSWSLALEQ